MRLRWPTPGGMSVGGAIWCVGVKASCACISGGSAGATDPDAKLIIDHRIKLYEHVHNVRHLGECDKAVWGITRPRPNSTQGLRFECEAYRAEKACLNR